MPRLQYCQAAPTFGRHSLPLCGCVCVCWPSLGNFNCNFCFLLAQLATPSSLSLSLSPLSGNVCNIFVEISLKMTWKSLLSTQFSLVFRDDAVAPAVAGLIYSFIHSHSLLIVVASLVQSFVTFPPPFDLPLRTFKLNILQYLFNFSRTHLNS